VAGSARQNNPNAANPTTITSDDEPSAVPLSVPALRRATRACRVGEQRGTSAEEADHARGESRARCPATPKGSVAYRAPGFAGAPPDETCAPSIPAPLIARSSAFLFVC
jgi:hypothetical protein